MAASERLYELWLLYYAQVSPRRPCPQLRAPGVCCTCARRHLGRVYARAGRARAPHARVRPRPAGASGTYTWGVGPRGRAPYKSLLGGDSAASVVPEERGLDQDRALTPFTDGETEAWGE